MEAKFTRLAAFSRLVLICLVLCEVLKPVGGAKFVVGANFVSGALWTNDPGPSHSNTTLVEQYEMWAKSVKISVGDTLQFLYDDSHTVVLVSTKEMYDSCNYATYTDVTSPTPPTLYIVNDTQPLYFVCSIDKHCAEGQKVAITNILPASSPTPSVYPAPPPAFSNGGRLMGSLDRLRSCWTVASSTFMFLLSIT
ncbi:hypothetical protein MPTK2_7g00010 [Marchantia polymorpha subsp. ruderalis]